MKRKPLHPFLHKYDIETRARIMIEQLERQIWKLKAIELDPRPVVQWLNEILPLVRQLRYEENKNFPENTPLAEEELQKHWEEFIVLFLDDILV